MPKTFGEVLKEVRKTIGLNATEMAKFLGVSQSIYSRYENNYFKKIDWDLMEKVLPYIKSGSIISQDEIEYTKYKRELVQRIEDMNDKIRQINNQELNEYLGNLEIKDITAYYEVIYCNKQYRIEKNGFSNTVGLCSIILSFISGILLILQDEIIKNFDSKLVQLYVLYDNLKNEMMTH